MEIEWNNKDPFYDRDLNNFRLLFELRAVSVGVIVTRCNELQEIFDALGRGTRPGWAPWGNLADEYYPDWATYNNHSQSYLDDEQGTLALQSKRPSAIRQPYHTLRRAQKQKNHLIDQAVFLCIQVVGATGFEPVTYAL